MPAAMTVVTAGDLNGTVRVSQLFFDDTVPGFLRESGQSDIK
jgi:hypothetical protein